MATQIVVDELITKLGFKADKSGLDKGKRMLSGFKKFAIAAAATVAVAVAGIGTAAIISASNMEDLTAQFEIMLGSTEKALAMMDRLKKEAASTPFQIGDLAKNTQNLLAFGVAETEVIGVLRMLGDTAGGNAEKLSGLALAYGKVTTKGKASMEEMNMLAERGLPIFKVLTKQLGVNQTQLFKMISRGKITASEITKAFRTMTSEGGMFYKGMEKASLTLSGIWSTFKDNVILVAAELGEGILPTIKQVLKTLIKIVQGPIAKLVKQLSPITQALGDELLLSLDLILEAFNSINGTSEDLVDTLVTITGWGIALYRIFYTVFVNGLHLFIKGTITLFTDLMQHWTQGWNMFLLGLQDMKAGFYGLWTLFKQLWVSFHNGATGAGLIFGKVFEGIAKTFSKVWDYIVGKIEFLTNWISAIPGIDFNIPQIGKEFKALMDFAFTPLDNMRKMVANNQRIQNIKMDAVVHQTFGDIGDATGVGSATREGLGAGFQAHIQELLLARY